MKLFNCHPNLTIFHAPPTTSTPGIFNNCNCFLPLRIINSIVLKSARRTDDDSFRNCSRAYDVVVLDEKYSSSFTGRWCDGCIGTTTFFRSFRIDSRRMDRYRAKTSRCNPESLLVMKEVGWLGKGVWECCAPGARQMNVMFKPNSR